MVKDDVNVLNSRGKKGWATTEPKPLFSDFKPHMLEPVKMGTSMMMMMMMIILKARAISSPESQAMPGEAGGTSTAHTAPVCRSGRENPAVQARHQRQ